MPVLNRIQLRRGTAAAGSNQWTNEILYSGEIGYETDTGKFKIGDGITQWGSLGYASVLPSEIAELIEDTIGSKVVGGTGITVSYNDTTGQTSVTLAQHQHQVADIQDFAQSVALYVPVQSVSAGSGISISSQNGTYTVSLSDPVINVSDISGLTVSATELNYLDGSTPGTVVANTAVVASTERDIQGIRNLTIDGNLTVNGTSTYINSTVIAVDDKNIELGTIDNPTDTTADGGGIILKGTDDIDWKWVNSSQSWTSSEHINLNSSILTYKINGTTVIGDSKIGASGYSLATGVLVDGGTP